MIKLESFIDQTLLKPETTSKEIETLCAEAIRYNFHAVFVNPTHVEFAAGFLKGTPLQLGSVCGFPLGATRTDIKVYEAEVLENAGATEIDMVANIGAIKDENYLLVKREIEFVRKALAGSTILKIILECTLLNDDEIRNAARTAVDSGADFVKTSTGFLGGATLHHVSLLFETVGSRVGIKAAGGIRDLKTTLAMIEAGASRIGTSSGVKIMEEYLSRRIK